MQCFLMMNKKQQFTGLTDEQVLESRTRHGRNVLTPPKKDSLLRLFLSKFEDPLITILMVVGVFSIGVSCYEYWGLHEEFKVFFEPIGIFVAILLATGLGFYFELKAQKEFTILNKENDHEKVAVIRNGNVTEIPKCDVVVGDILVLQTGQEIPADALLLEALSLIVDESSLTGEPAHSKTTEISEDIESTYPSNHIYRGTQILEGHGYAEVLAVGDKTENGRIMQSLMGVDIDKEEKNTAFEGLNDTQKKALRLQEKNKVTRKIKTPLDEQLASLSKLITNLSYIFAGAIIVAKLLVYFDWLFAAWALLIPTVWFFWLVIKRFDQYSRWKCLAIIVGFFAIFIGMVLGLHILTPEKELSHLLAYALETIMIAVALVVVAVPEGLPMAVSLSLANSMRKMLKTNNLVRKMHACETMGATTVICTDKTGTLTQNLMQVKECLLDKGPLMFEGIAVNSTASLDLTAEKPRVIGNPTEGALLLWLAANGQDYKKLRLGAKRLKEIPFSAERKYMASLVESGVIKGRKILYVKGAPEIIMKLCKYVPENYSWKNFMKALNEYQQKAMRTLAIAYQIVNDGQPTIEDGQLVAKDLVLAGVVGIEDPIRDDVKEAVEKCLNAGIDVKIVTGDTMGTAQEIGRQIGIWKDGYSERNIIDGQSFAALSEKELLERVNDLKIIARARPMDKKRLVEALQAKDHVVAVTGDGTNDAPALNAAHVGLSMGAGTKVAKEASDITIIDNSFASIVRAVKWGRSLFQNIQRFLLYQLTVNVAACLLVLFGAFMGTESPLTVTQMLWVNLIMDTFAAFALSALPPTEKVMADKPRDRNAFILDKSLLTNILGVGVFFFVLLLGLLYVFQHSDIHQLTDLLDVSLSERNTLTPYELTLLFTIFVMTHFWYLFNARAFKTGGSGLNLKGCDSFITIAIIILVGQVAIVQLPVLNSFFNVEPLKISDWCIIIGLSAFVMVVREFFALVKRMRKTTMILAVVALSCTMLSCSLSKSKTLVSMLPESKPMLLTEQQKAFANDNNGFTLNFMKTVNDIDHEGKGFIYSPLSITYVLAMVNDAAMGATEKELEQKLGFHEGGIQAVNEFCKNLIDNLPKVDPKVQLNIANAIFLNQDNILKEEFRQDMHDYFDATAEALDFSSKKSLGIINDWCNKKTKGMIPSILDSVDPNMVSYLLNAIYFKADWTKKFNKKNTKTELFNGENGRQKIPMMQQKVLIRYVRNTTYAAIDIPYGNELWSMTVLLPEEGKTTDDVINRLAETGWTGDYARHPMRGAQTYEVDLKLPRFETTSDTDNLEGSLIGILEKMGITLVFDPANNEIPNMCEQPAYVNMIRQKAKIKVNEEGSEAAAVTASGILGGSAAGGPRTIPKADFHATRPFVYVINEHSSGVILFVGKYTGK
ncbi:MAG: HAD-IC family P-type ATPase [Prevotella sp.]|nr:HAD-IC family P-type ATPase [Prevotella sp.]